METKKIDCDFDRDVLKVLKCIVPGQRMKLEDGEGRIWTSEVTEKEEMAITIIKRNEGIVAKIVYDYETGREEIFLVGSDE